MLTLFCKHPAVKDADLSSIRVVFLGGTLLSVHLAQTMGEIVPQAVVEQGYGMTELTGILTMPPVNRRVVTDAVGHFLPGFTERIVKPDGSLADIGESGEFWVRSGDQLYFDENRELHVVDRIKDFIKVGGFQVAPAELEARLRGNPQIVRRPEPAALARVRENPEEGKNIKTALIQDIASNMAKYKALAGGVEFIDAIPNTPSGKLLRRSLRVGFSNTRVRRSFSVWPRTSTWVLWSFGEY
ncbi:hypothetical protein C8R44DRAFT_868778 [Mycena epipterygia]|nr:hypothetical protein C8R44DRAFT_868778 [Mycena epipterygia]